MKTYQEYVELGKAIVDQVNDRQMKICSYAIEVCTIRHGGKSAGFYTLKDYANDIGLNNKTLNQWMLVYRNVILKLTPKQRETLTWKLACKANEMLEESNTVENRLKGIPRSKRCTKSRLSPERVQLVYDHALEEKPFVSEFLNMVKWTKHGIGLLKKRDLTMIEDTHLVHLMELLDESSEIINEYLTQKKRKASA
jgi:hypothetical protein